jgi:hypothetical protein
VTATTVDLLAETIAAAVGHYSCPCGSQFELDAAAELEDYAALNRWLGRHFEGCGVLEADELAREIASLKAERSELYRQLQAWSRGGES